MHRRNLSFLVYDFSIRIQLENIANIMLPTTITLAMVTTTTSSKTLDKVVLWHKYSDIETVHSGSQIS